MKDEGGESLPPSYAVALQQQTAGGDAAAMTSHDMTSHAMTSQDGTSQGMTQQGMTSYMMTSYGSVTTSVHDLYETSVEPLQARNNDVKLINNGYHITERRQ